jgi:hypothetical protein
MINEDVLESRWMAIGLFLAMIAFALVPALY